MSQASSWQRILDIYLSVESKQLRLIYRRALYCAVFAFLWWMNWKLFLATTVGIALMSFCYLAQNSHWQRYWQKWRDFLVGSNRQLALAVGAGASGAFCTYLAASVWADADNRWLATGSILQGLASLTTLALLLRSLGNQKTASVENKLEQLLADLSHGDRLKRLVAIRQLTRLLSSKRLSGEHYYQTLEYYHLMLSEPQPPAIENALLESLESLTGEQTASIKTRSKVRVPLNLHRSSKPVLNKIIRS